MRAMLTVHSRRTRGHATDSVTSTALFAQFSTAHTRDDFRGNRSHSHARSQQQSYDHHRHCTDHNPLFLSIAELALHRTPRNTQGVCVMFRIAGAGSSSSNRSHAFACSQLTLHPFSYTLGNTIPAAGPVCRRCWAACSSACGCVSREHISHTAPCGHTGNMASHAADPLEDCATSCVYGAGS